MILTHAAREQPTIKAVALCQKILKAHGLELRVTFYLLGINIPLGALLKNLISICSSFNEPEGTISCLYENILNSNLYILIFKSLGSKWADKRLRSEGHRFPEIKLPFFPLESKIYLLVSLKNT
jgi:hypothetical protein